MLKYAQENKAVRMELKNSSIFPLASLCLLTPTPANAFTDEEIEVARDLVAQQARGTQTGAGYAQLIGFVSDPDISGITLKDENEGTLDIFKLPLQHRVQDREDWSLFVRGGFSYATLAEDEILQGFPSDNNIDTKWKSYSATAGLMGKWKLAPQWRFIGAVDFGLARLENDTSYRGIADVLAPIFDDLLFNWKTNATLVSGMLGLDYHLEWSSVAMNAKAHYLHAYIDSFDESGDFAGFTEHADTLHFDVDVKHPLGVELNRYPLNGIALVGNTTFVGDNRDALGFTTMWSFGYAVQADISRNEWPVQSVRLGASYLKGDKGVDGYQIILGYRF